MHHVCCPLPNVVFDHGLQFCNVYLFDKEIRCGIQTVLLVFLEREK
jgi:hypothetical protein